MESCYQNFDFIAIDQNNNIAKEHVTLDIKIPDIEVIDLKKSGEETADIIAKDFGVSKGYAYSHNPGGKNFQREQITKGAAVSAVKIRERAGI